MKDIHNRCLGPLKCFGFVFLSPIRINSQSFVLTSSGNVSCNTYMELVCCAKHHPSTSSTSRSHWSCHCDESKSKPNEFNGRCLSRGSNSWIMFTSWTRLGGKFGRGFQFAAQKCQSKAISDCTIHQKAIDERPFPPSSHPKKVVYTQAQHGLSDAQ